MKRILIFLTLLTVIAGLANAEPWNFTISGNDTADCDDAYIVSNQATTNYGTATTISIGSSWNIQSALIRWPNVDDTFALGSGTTYPEADVDTALLGIVLSGAIESGDTISLKAYTLKRAWVEAEATYNIFSTDNNWGTAGATGAGDIFSDCLDSVTLHSGNTAQYDTVWIPLNPENFGSTYKSVLVKYSYKAGTDPVITAAYASDHTSAIGPILRVVSNGGSSAPDGLASFSVDSLHNDYSTEYDSALAIFTTGSQSWCDSVIITLDTSQPDSSTGVRLAIPYAASTTDTGFGEVNITEPDWMYVSFWVMDVDSGWSDRQIDSIYYGSGDSDPPDVYDYFEAMMVLNLNPDTVQLAVGAVDSTDLSRTIIRWDTTAIPADTTDGFSLFAGDDFENDTSDYLLTMAQPDWVYFSIFALDEVGNASDAVSDSIYFPGGGAGGETTGRTNRMFEFLISRQEKMTR